MIENANIYAMSTIVISDYKLELKTAALSGSLERLLAVQLNKK